MNATTSPATYLTSTDVAARFGVSLACVSNWRRRYADTSTPFPAPEEGHPTPVWHRDRWPDIAAWNKQRGGHRAGRRKRGTNTPRRRGRDGYLHLADVAELLEVLRSYVRQWVNGDRPLPEPFPVPDEVTTRGDKRLVWWRESRRDELVEWRQRHLAYLADQVRHRRRPTRGPRRRPADGLADIAGTFLAADPVLAFQALAVIHCHGDDGALTPAQRAVAARAYELACMIDEVVESDEARRWVGRIMQDVAPRQARSPHYLGAVARFAFLLDKLGQDELIDRIGRLCAADDAHQRDEPADNGAPPTSHTSPAALQVPGPIPGAAPYVAADAAVRIGP